MKKIKLFTATETKEIEGEAAELYFNFYLVLNKNYIFTFLIDGPNLSCSDRNPIRLWKHWLMLFEEEYVKYLRRYEKGPTVSKVEALLKRHTKKMVSATIWGCKEVIDIHKDSEGKVDAEEVKKALDRLKESEGKE
jgi:hypothetical protein